MSQKNKVPSTSCHEARPFLAIEPLAILEEGERGSLDAHILECLACHDRAARLRDCHDSLAEAEVEGFNEDAVWERVEAGLAAGDFLEDAELEPAPPRPVITIGLACTFCHDGLVRAEAHYCAACLAPHHVECLREHGRCSALGCEETSTVRPRALVGEAAPARRRGRAAPFLIALLVGGPLAGLGAAAFVGYSRYVSQLEAERVAARSAADRARSEAQALAAAAADKADALRLSRARESAERRASAMETLARLESMEDRVVAAARARLSVIPKRRRELDATWREDLAPRVAALRGLGRAIRNLRPDETISGEDLDRSMAEIVALEASLQGHIEGTGPLLVPVDLSFLNAGGAIEALVARASEALGAVVVFEEGCRQREVAKGSYAADSWRETLRACVESAGLRIDETEGGNFIIGLGDPKVTEVFEEVTTHEALDRLRRYRDRNIVTANSVRGVLGASFDGKSYSAILESIAASHSLAMGHLGGAVVITGPKQSSYFRQETSFLPELGWRGAFRAPVASSGPASRLGLEVHLKNGQIATPGQTPSLRLPSEGPRIAIRPGDSLGAVSRAAAAAGLEVVVSPPSECERPLGLDCAPCTPLEAVTLAARRAGLAVERFAPFEDSVVLRDERLVFNGEGEARRLASGAILSSAGPTMVIWRRPKTFVVARWAPAKLVFAALDELSGQDFLITGSGSRLSFDLRGLPYLLSARLAAEAMDAAFDTRGAIITVSPRLGANVPDLSPTREHEGANSEIAAYEAWGQPTVLDYDEGSMSTHLLVQGVIGEAGPEPKKRMAIINNRLYHEGEAIVISDGVESKTRLLEIGPDTIKLGPAKEGGPPQVLKVRP